MNPRILILVLVAAAMSLSMQWSAPDWGFYGHRKINRMAVFALPSDMIGFYKKNIEYITDHAVDPDKRRYATKYEAIRHYIDIDHWDVIPFPKVPRNFSDALIRYGKFQIKQGEDLDSLDILERNDSLIVSKVSQLWWQGKSWEWRKMFDTLIMPQYYEDVKIVSGQTLQEYWPNLPIDSTSNLIFVDRFSEYGVLPYHLVQHFNKLKNAFRREDAQAVLRESAEIGHYIGDAHVPLHTTVNYNGQLTDQVGIHAFWESRLPELFAEEKYDFLVGRADFIEDLDRYIWSIITESHRLLEDVLRLEKELSQSFPQDQQYCYDERLARTVRIECEEYAQAYHDAMGDMVERRMRDATKSIADIWYTAWTLGGQPDMDDWYDEISKGEKEEFEFIGGSHDARQ